MKIVYYPFLENELKITSLLIVPRPSFSIKVTRHHLTIDHSFCYIVDSSQTS